MLFWCYSRTPIYVVPSLARPWWYKLIDFKTGLPQVIVAMITSRMFRGNHPSRISVVLSSPVGQQSGLLTDSVIMCDNLATVGEQEIDRVIGMLPMKDVDIALRHTLGL